MDFSSGWPSAVRNLWLAALMLIACVGALCAETVRFETSDGVQMIGDVFGPPNPKGAIVLHHGLGSVGGEWASFAHHLAQAGYGVLIYDARGHGKSTRTKAGGTVDFHYFFGRGLKSEWGTMISDMGDAVRFAAETFNIDRRKIGVGGASIGANIAFRFAASQPDVPYAVLLSPGMDYQGITVSDLLPGYLKSKKKLFVASSKADRYAHRSARAMRDVSAYLGSGGQTLFMVEKRGHGTQMFARKNSKEPSALEANILKWIESQQK